jgi:transposase
MVAAPGKIERPAQDRVKTDRRDAERLVRLLMIGGLHAVRVPTPAKEAMRDLVRAREDVRGDLMRARHRVAKLLLRHDLHFEGNNWTQRHLDWLGRVELLEPVAQAVLLDGISAIVACWCGARVSRPRWLRSSRALRGSRRSLACAASGASTP